MDSQENMSFTNLLQRDSNLDKQFLSESQCTPMSVEASPPQVQIPTSKTRWCDNFTIEEDKLLVSAWLNTSLDAVHRNEQKHEAFYERIAAYFEEYKEFDSERSTNSLSNRWSTINSVSLKVLIPINWLINPRIFMRSKSTRLNSSHYGLSRMPSSA